MVGVLTKFELLKLKTCYFYHENINYNSLKTWLPRFLNIFCLPKIDHNGPALWNFNFGIMRRRAAYIKLRIRQADSFFIQKGKKYIFLIQGYFYSWNGAICCFEIDFIANVELKANVKISFLFSWQNARSTLFVSDSEWQKTWA